MRLLGSNPSVTDKKKRFPQPSSSNNNDAVKCPLWRRLLSPQETNSLQESFIAVRIFGDVFTENREWLCGECGLITEGGGDWWLIPDSLCKFIRAATEAGAETERGPCAEMGARHTLSLEAGWHNIDTNSLTLIWHRVSESTWQFCTLLLL